MLYTSNSQHTILTTVTLFFSLLALAPVYGQSVYDSLDTKEVKVYNKKGKSKRWKSVLKDAKDYDVVLFGELHNNALNHYLQMDLVQYLYDKSPSIVLGAEMFEADNQVLLDEYLLHVIDSAAFAKDARLWPNYSSDYQPFVVFARDYSIPFVATNIPRRYAKQVYQKGKSILDSLPTLSQRFVAPLPLNVDSTTPGYADLLHMDMGHGHGFNGLYFMQSQAVKDATMAHFIHKNLPEEGTFIHLNGNYHSREYGGIYWWLKKINPELKIMVISVAEADEYNEDYATWGDYQILFPVGRFHSY